MNKFEEAAKKKAEEKKEARIKARDEAQKYIDAYHKEHGNNAYISLRIRDGFIGKEIGGGNLQLTRTKPRGTMVAIKGEEDGEVKIGWTYLNKEDEDIPIVGIMKALKAAQTNETPKLKNKNDKDLLNFFAVRAKCYFYPEKYSHSRGTEKIDYPNYDKVHYLRQVALDYLSKQVN